MKKIPKEIGIYKLYWSNCRYFYYGQSRDLNKRKIGHYNKLEKQKHCNQVMQRIFNKYGLPLFKIVEYCTLDFLNNTEQIYLDKYFSRPTCCNLNPKAESSKDRKMSQATKDKLSLAKMGHPSYIRTPENRAATSERGKLYKTSDATKLLLRDINLGKKYSDETNKKKSTKRYGKDNPRSKKVVQLDYDGNIINVFDSIRIASEHTGLGTSSIRDTCNGRINKKNLFFKFA